jgi:hypothetical protein
VIKAGDWLIPTCTSIQDTLERNDVKLPIQATNKNPKTGNISYTKLFVPFLRKDHDSGFRIDFWVMSPEHLSHYFEKAYRRANRETIYTKIP